MAETKKTTARSGKKIKMVLPKAHHHTRGASLENRAGEDLIITWYMAAPMYIEGTKNPGTTVNCVLTGPNGFSENKPADIMSDTYWSVDFGIVGQAGSYDFEADGSDDSSCGVTINILPGAFPD